MTPSLYYFLRKEEGKYTQVIPFFSDILVWSTSPPFPPKWEESPDYPWELLLP